MSGQRRREAHIYIYSITYVKEYYSAMKKNDVMPFAETWMDLEIIIPSEVSQRQIPYDITYIWNLKTDANELMYKTDSQKREQTYGYKKGKGKGKEE